MYTSVSSVQRSTQTIFIVTLKLPSSTTRDTLATGCSMEISHRVCSLQLLCPGSFAPIQTASDYSQYQDRNFQVILRSCRKFDPNFHGIHPNSSHSIHRFSSHHHTRDCSCENFQWDTSLQILEFLSLSLISVFQDLINQFSRFYPCTSLWTLLIFLMIFHYLLYSFLCPHSWTMTCCVCPCQTIACLCSCVHCSLGENLLHGT